MAIAALCVMHESGGQALDKKNAGRRDVRRPAIVAGNQFSGWPTRAAWKPTSGVWSEKIEANQPGFGTSDGGKALQPAFISSQEPVSQYLIVSLVTIGSGRVV